MFLYLSQSRTFRRCAQLLAIEPRPDLSWLVSHNSEEEYDCLVQYASKLNLKNYFPSNPRRSPVRRRRNTLIKRLKSRVAHGAHHNVVGCMVVELNCTSHRGKPDEAREARACTHGFAHCKVIPNRQPHERAIEYSLSLGLIRHRPPVQAGSLQAVVGAKVLAMQRECQRCAVLQLSEIAVAWCMSLIGAVISFTPAASRKP